MDIEVARSRLQDLLADLDRSVATLRGEGPTDNGDEATEYDRHPTDSASNLSDADRASALIEASQRQRDQVRAALERIEDGTYGACTDCGCPLPDERLDARPEAARCVQCQSKLEERR